MVKKKSNISRNLSKNANNRSGVGCFKKIIFRYKFVFILLIIVVGFLGYKYTAIYLEKRSFLAKEKKLEQLADKIANQYPPDIKSSEKYCRYQNQKITRGGRSCVFNYIFIYSNLNIEEANSKKNHIAELNDSVGLLNNFNNNAVEFSEKDLTSIQGYIKQDLEVLGLSGCDITYLYEIGKDKTGNLEINAGCSTNPKSEIFPVKE